MNEDVEGFHGGADSFGDDAMDSGVRPAGVEFTGAEVEGAHKKSLVEESPAMSATPSGNMATASLSMPKPPQTGGRPATNMEPQITMW